MISVAQIRAARGLLGWSQDQLADGAGLSVPTVKRMEAQSAIRVSDDARNAVRRALEKAGVEFIEENGGGAGVRLKKRSRSKSLRVDQLSAENDG
jgi:transcriptional regulator with XRE-family HTH domain